jgi:hypothetical protein
VTAGARQEYFLLIEIACNKFYRWFMNSLMDHRIAGPFRGYFLAFYAAMEEGGFLGYYKICTSRPVDYWGCACMRKGCTEIVFSTPDAAMNAAEDAARMTLKNLPPVMELLHRGSPSVVTSGTG